MERDLSPTLCGHSKKVTVCKPGRKFSSGPELVSTLILDILPYRRVRNKFCCLNHAAYVISLWQPEHTYAVRNQLSLLLCLIVTHKLEVAKSLNLNHA